MRSTASSSTTFFAEQKRIARYFAVGGVAACVAATLVNYLGHFPLYAKLVATGTVFFWNYLARRLVIFEVRAN